MLLSVVITCFGCGGKGAKGGLRESRDKTGGRKAGGVGDEEGT